MKKIIIPGILLLLISGTAISQEPGTYKANPLPPFIGYTRNITDAVSAAVTKEAAHSITASSLVNPSNGAVNYHAGSFVELNPGFNTDITSSSSFTASIEADGKKGSNTSGSNAKPLKEEVGAVIGFSVYPNPARNTLFFQLPQHTKVLSVEIRDEQGRLMPVMPRQGEIQAINISKLIAGNYFLKVNVKGNSYSTMFIKQ